MHDCYIGRICTMRWTKSSTIQKHTSEEVVWSSNRFAEPIVNCIYFPYASSNPPRQPTLFSSLSLAHTLTIHSPFSFSIHTTKDPFPLIRHWLSPSYRLSLSPSLSSSFTKAFPIFSFFPLFIRFNSHSFHRYNVNEATTKEPILAWFIAPSRPLSLPRRVILYLLASLFPRGTTFSV